MLAEFIPVIIFTIVIKFVHFGWKYAGTSDFRNH